VTEIANFRKGAKYLRRISSCYSSILGQAVYSLDDFLLLIEDLDSENNAGCYAKIPGGIGVSLGLSLMLGWGGSFTLTNQAR
jgi:hypothetical protein